MQSQQNSYGCLFIFIKSFQLHCRNVNLTIKANQIQFHSFYISFNNQSMPFWDRKKKQLEPQAPSTSTVVIMHSQVLGMTVIEDDNTQGKVTELSHAEWIDVIESQDLSGFPFERIYFSFLKGIPTFLRLKIWLMLCTQNNTRKFHYTSCKDGKKQGSGLKIEELTVQIYCRLCEQLPKPKEVEQIEKDIKRSFSIEKAKYRFLAPLLRKLLYASSNSNIEYSQGMNYILLNIIIYSLEALGVDENNIQALQPRHERDIFVIFRETVMRMEEVFGQNNIFKVIGDLQQKISQNFPQILFVIYKYGLDGFSAFSQNYYSVMSYNDPPEELCRMMLDLFFLTGEQAIHAITIKMLQVTKSTILAINNAQSLQKFVKQDIYHEFYKEFLKKKETAKTIGDFGLSFFDSIQRLEM